MTEREPAASAGAGAEDVPAAFTVADALALPAFRDGVPEVLAGRDQLHRAIRWVHSGEFPDMPSVLKGGEMLLTHGMSIPAQADRRRRYVADLDRAGITALVIELGSGVDAVGAQLVAEARARDLPLIVLHRPTPWVEVTETIHRAIVSRQDALLQARQALHERFFGLLAAGAGVAEIVHALADAVTNPVILTRGHELLYSAPRGVGASAVSAGWDAVSRRLGDAPDCLSVPVAAAGSDEWGVTSVLALERPLEPLDRLAVEQAVPLLALALLRSHESEALAARDRGDFFSSLLDPSEALSEHQTLRRAAGIGFSRRTSWLLPVAVDLAAGFGRVDERHWAVIAREIRGELAAQQTPAVVGTSEGARHLTLVLGLGAPEQVDGVLTRLVADLQRSVRRAGHDAPVVTCAGRPVGSWRELRDSLGETIDALGAMRSAPPRPWHDVSSPTVHQLLWRLRDAPPLIRFVERTLAPLADHDRIHSTQLLATVAAYCAHGGRKASTARALHLERQSLYKRLARISALTGLDLEDEETRLGLHLALRARPILANEPLTPA